jgi:hypothetical protein
MANDTESFSDFVRPEKFFRDGKAFRKDTQQTYDISYPEFLQYFETVDTLSKHHLVIGINFTYGWMPTILDFRSDRFEEAVAILNRAKAGRDPDLHDLALLKQLFNNSLVGTSKLLHFIRPTLFPIWDSRVFRYLTGEEPYAHRIGNVRRYLRYVAFCRRLVELPAFEEVHRHVCTQTGYPLSPLRAAELVMFRNG